MVDAEHSGPFVGAAFLCEQILRDESGVVSVIRIVDRITHTVSAVDPPDEMPPLEVEIKGLLLLKDGSARGRGMVKFRLEEPSGLRHDLIQKAVQFSGGGHGTNIELNFHLRLSSEGLYWIDVLLRGELLTRIPLEVVYDPVATPAARN